MIACYVGAALDIISEASVTASNLVGNLDLPNNECRLPEAIGPKKWWAFDATDRTPTTVGNDLTVR